MAKKPRDTRFGFYPSYHFIDHDPILDQVDRLFELTAATSFNGKPMSFEQISRKSGVTTSTLRNWHKRKTKKPQFATVKAVVRAMGGQLTIVYNGKEIRGTPPVRLVKSA